MASSFNWGATPSTSVWSAINNVSQAVSNMTIEMMNTQEMATTEMQQLLQSDALKIDNPADKTSGKAWADLTPVEQMNYIANNGAGWNYTPAGYDGSQDMKNAEMTSAQANQQLLTQARSNDANQADNITSQINGVVSNMQGRITELLTIGQSMLTLWQNLVG